MTNDQREILRLLYELESARLAQGEFEIWTTPANLLNALPIGHEHSGDEGWLRGVLEELWSMRKVLQVPDNEAPNELKDVELRSQDAYTESGSSRIPLEANDCRGFDGHPWQRVAIYESRAGVRYRSRVAEIARLLSQNYQRFRMLPSTGLLRYELRPQTRPEYEVLIDDLIKRLGGEIQQGVFRPELISGLSLEYPIDTGVDRSRLIQAMEAVLVALAEEFQNRGQAAKLADFQVRSICATLCGLYSESYRNQYDAHIITAGVGSGKSFAFQMGALIHVGYKALMGERGIQILFLYPRVVLAANQFQDLFRMVAAVATKLKVKLAEPVLDAGGQLVGQYGGPPTRGLLFTALREHYQQDRQIVISNLDTLANRLVHPEASEGLASNLDLIVLDEVHILSGLYGAHAKMLLKRLQQLRGMWALRRRFPNALFEEILSRTQEVRAPYFVGASATISEPRQHLARILSDESQRMLHIEVGQTQEMGWIHHIFLRQRPESSSMTAATNAVSCLIHNRRDGLFHEYYQERSGPGPLSIDRIDNPAQPSQFLEPTDTKLLHKTLGFCDSLDGVNRWADLIADNERSKSAAMGSSANPAIGDLPYFTRFQEPLWRVVHHETFGANPPAWQQALWSHYGALCRDCKRGVKRRITRIPAGLRQAQQERVEQLWDFTPNNDESYLHKLGVHADFVRAAWFKPVADMGDAETIGNLDECGFFAAGLCWWWSKDDLGSNHPAPVSGAQPLNGYKKPLAHPQDKYLPLNAVRVRSFTSKSDFDLIGSSINDVFRSSAKSIFRDRNFPDAEENCALVIGSPRIEVGIDLSRVSEGLTYRAMRDPASLQQKVGRIGRELVSDSVVVHLVTENARDHFYFRNPRIALDPEYLQPIPLHENNQLVARNHYFMAIVDFLCLQGTGPSAGRIPAEGDRINLINDHKFQQRSFRDWDRKVAAVYEFLFGNHLRQADNLSNLTRYLQDLGATGDEASNPNSALGLGPADGPTSMAVGAIDVFRHEFGPNLLQTPLTIAGRPLTLAQACATMYPAPTQSLPQLPRHDAFLKSLPNDEPQRDRSYLWQILTLPLFRRGIPALSLPGNQPYLWSPNFFEAVGKEYVRVFEEIDGRQRELGFETVSLALALLSPGTVTYRYSPSPRKVAVARFGAAGLSPRLPLVEAVRLNISDSDYFEPARCGDLTESDLPNDFLWTGQNVPVFKPRQIGLISSRSEPLVTPDGLMADDDSRPSSGQASISVPTPPRCFPLRWYRIETSQTNLSAPDCRFRARFNAPSGQNPLPSLALPEILGMFSAVGYDERLRVTDFVWGLDRQFMTRKFEAARLVYWNADLQQSSPIALGHHYETMGLQFTLDLGPGGRLKWFLDELGQHVESGPYQATLIHVLSYFLRENGLNPLVPGAPPWMEPSRPSIFAVRNLTTIIWFHLLERWHPNPSSGAGPVTPFLPQLDDLVGCFTLGHANFISEDRFRELCQWIASVQNPASVSQRFDTLCASYPNFEKACERAGQLDAAFFRDTAQDLLLNTLGIAMHGSALRLTGAEAGDLGYFYKKEQEQAQIYLFDSDEFGNGTADLVRQTMYVSPIERILVAKLRALGADADPLPTVDYASCLEDALQECDSSHVFQLAFHDVPALGACLQGLDGARQGELQIGGPVFEFLRTRLNVASVDTILAFQNCPEFLAHLGQYGRYQAEALVPSSVYPTFQALESAMGFCVDGCIECVVSPEYNVHGVLSAKETVSKLLLDAFYRTTVCESASPVARLCYPGTDVGRTEMWGDLANRVAATLGKSSQGVQPILVELTYPGGSTTVAVVPSAVPSGWDRVFRPTWELALAPQARVRPRMLL